MELNKIIEKLEKIFPLNLKEEWDNCGLAVGDITADIKKVMISLDVTDKVIEKAIENKCELIIAHHPMIFKSVQSITSKTLTGKRIMKLIKANIALYTIHTNGDSALGGLNDFIANKIGAKTTKIADPKYHDTAKLAFFVPESHSEIVRSKIMKINKFSPNDYIGVTYLTKTEETYINKAEVDVQNDIEKTKKTLSVKIEAIVFRQQIKEIVSEIKKVHPYKDPAYEIMETDRRFQSGGIGRIFELDTSEDIEIYLERIKKILGITKMKAVFAKGSKVKKIGIINGSGMSFMKKMREHNIDLFLTADIKYHEAMEAKEFGVSLADIGHYESEVVFGEMIAEKINDKGLILEIFNDEPVFAII